MTVVAQTSKLGAVALIVLLAACSTPGTRVTLLPQPDGSASAVVVSTRNGGQKKLDQPYQRATVKGRDAAAPALDQTTAVAMRAENPALFDLLPPPPERQTVYFEAGGTVLTVESRRILTAAVESAMARSGGEILVTGHTDTKGTAAQNDPLSLQRAQQVRQMFIDRKFPAARIEAVGRGKREPAVPTADNVDEPRNRRVTIEVR